MRRTTLSPEGVARCDTIRYDTIWYASHSVHARVAVLVHCTQKKATEERASGCLREWEREKNTYMKSSWRENIDLFSFVNGEHTPHTTYRSITCIHMKPFFRNRFSEIFFDLVMAGSVVLQTWIIMRILFTTLPLITHWVLFFVWIWRTLCKLIAKNCWFSLLPREIFSTAFSLWK